MRQIADRSEKGHDLNPYLSVRATRTGKQANDALLNDWGINHFHLGRIAPDGSVDRTSDLLFVVVQPETLYFLEVLDHGSFEAESLFLTMEAEFPHLVEPYRLDVIEAQTPDEAGRRLLRQAGFTLMTKGKHGYYFGPGGGVVASGRSSRVIDQALRLVNRLTTDVLAKQMEIRRNLGLGPADTFKLVFRDGGFVPVRT